MDDREFVQMHTGYMIEAFGDIQRIADKMRRSSILDETDTLVGMGLSGALVVPRLADLLGKHWAIVRKDDGTHSSNKIEGQIGRKWLFVDDLVSTGSTLRRVQQTISDVMRREDFSTQYVGTYQYHYDSFIFPENGH